MKDEVQARVIKKAIISVYHKESVKELVECLHGYGVEIISTGGTSNYIHSLGIPVTTVESVTGYPSILGGRVKTLHPFIFGGILARRGSEEDMKQLDSYQLPGIDLVVVDLYPFEKAVADGEPHEAIIEKIDIGGISLIRAAAKNYHDVTVLASMQHADTLVDILKIGKGSIGLSDRKRLAAMAFGVSSAYDGAILHYLQGEETNAFLLHVDGSTTLRYGENPHQAGRFYGDLAQVFDQIQGKPLSYNNLLDIDAAMGLIAEFDRQLVFAVIKHTNVCGLAKGHDLLHVWKEALSGDPVSAFGGIIITNGVITGEVAEAINELFFEVLIAPGFDEEAMALFARKKNRILLKNKQKNLSATSVRTVLNGVLWQSADREMALPEAWTTVTARNPSEEEVADLLLANIAVKHLKSNAIALVRNNRLIGMGAGQTSRVDALRQAIEKASHFGHDLAGAVMASDAFFPFPDCVEIADQAGITAVIQPGGSVRDQESVAWCDTANMSMVMTGTRHFRH